VATNGDNPEAQSIFVAYLAINLGKKQVDFTNCVPIDSYLAYPDRGKEAMQQLLDMILGFFEAEVKRSRMVN